MLTVPLIYGDRMPDGSRKVVTVSADEGTISLALPVDVREVFSGTNRRPVEGLDEAMARARESAQMVPIDFVRVLADEVDRYRAMVDGIQPEADVRPDPSEARAIAAALIHHAGEVEEGRQ